MSTIDRSSLGDLSELNSGGQGTVYRIMKRPGMLFKQYHQPVNGRKLELLAKQPSRMDADRRDVVLSSSAWPLEIVVDRGRCVGMTMREASKEFHGRIGNNIRPLELQYLAFPPKGRWANLALPTADQRSALVGKYLRYAEILHRSDIILGDISLKNFFWSINGGTKIFALDCDSYLMNGHDPIMQPVETPDWEDPMLPDGVLPTMDSDRYKLALLVIRVLLQAPKATPASVAESAQYREALGEPVSALAVRMAQQDVRPRVDEWLRALSGRPTLRLPKNLRPFRKLGKPPGEPVSRPTLKPNQP